MRARVLSALRARVEEELASFLAVAKMASDEATGEESKAENQYDTRSLEASYLARGQAERIGATRALAAWLAGVPAAGHATAGAGSLVQVRSDGLDRWFFLVPFEGGRTLRADGVEVQVLSLRSPLGEALLGARVGDEGEVEAATGAVDWALLTVA